MLPSEGSKQTPHPVRSNTFDGDPVAALRRPMGQGWISFSERWCVANDGESGCMHYAVHCIPTASIVACLNRPESSPSGPCAL
jgi:hypothetical protein